MPGRPSTQEIYAQFEPLSAWLTPAMGEAAQPIIDEDATKRGRLLHLSEEIGLPIPNYIFVAPTDLDDAEALRQYFGDVDEASDRFAVVYLPRSESGSIKRHRGLSAADTIAWVQANKPAQGEYDCLIEPSYEHNRWSTIFIVGDDGIFGEIIEGQHFQLTQGSHVQGEPVQFLRKGNTFSVKGGTAEMRQVIWGFLDDIQITSHAMRQKLGREMDAEFTSEGYLKGYFEAVIDDRFGKAFIDYNRLLGAYFSVPETLTRSLDSYVSSGTVLHGQVVVEGMVEGTLLSAEHLLSIDEFEGAILTAPLTEARDIPLMQAVDGIVTEMGGLTSHAAIVARMLGKPCVVGAAEVTEYLEQDAVLDAFRGQITIS